MDDNDNKLKDKIVKLLKYFSIHILIKILIPILIVLIIFAAAEYYLTLDDAVYKENDLSNAPYVASQYIDNVDIGLDGQLSGSMTAQELWNLMEENNNRGLLYLDTPEELLKLMNAELVTQYLDTRSNPDEEINWDSMNDVESKDIQGIVKLKRADADGNISIMTYVDPDIFQSYIEQYNKSGSDEAKKLALSHFTLEQASSSSSTSSESDDIGIIQGTGSFTQYIDLTEQQIKAIANLCKQEQGSLKGAAAEASLMANRFELVGSKYGAGGTGLYNYVRNSGWFAHAGDHMDNGDAGQDYVDVVKAVLVNGKRTLPKYIDEHDCFSDISNATNNGGSISVSERSQYKQYVTNISNRYGSKYIFFCFPTDTSDPFGYTSKKNRKKYGDAYYDFDTGELINGTEAVSEDQSGNQSNKQSEDSLNEWYWPTDGTTITSKFGPRDAPVAGASTDHGGIDIGLSEGTNVYACDSGKVTIAGNSDSAGNWIVIDHGNGYVTKYMHNSKLKVSVGDKVKKGQVIALSGNTGNSSGPHLHFQVEYNGEVKDPLKFKYNNGMGDGSISVNSNSDSTSESSENSTALEWYAKVATWNEERTIIKSNDPSVSESDVTIYNMSSTNINYQDVVSGYTMPFEYLWALLVVTEDKDFVLELADLVYNSEIEITVHDNLTINTETEVNTYTKKKKTDTDAEVTIHYGKTTSFSEGASTESGSWIDEESNDYKVTETVINKNNTLDISLTKANVWMLEYTQEYMYEKPNATSTGPITVTLEDENYPNIPDSTSQDDTYGHAQNLFETQKKKYEEIYDYVGGSINFVEGKIYNAVINKKRETTYKTETTNYVSSPAKTREKTENSEDENNFITIFRKSEYKGAREKILEISSWLFEILESNDNTKDMVDLTKYLLYKATEKSYGVTEYDYTEFENNSFLNVDTGIYDGTIQEKVWFALKDLNYSDYAIAGAMGNIHYESGGFSTVAVEGGSGEGIGLIQWSFGRKEKLIKYANSKGVSWQDEDTQVEFLVAEICGKGPASKYADIRKSGYIGDEGITSTSTEWANATSVDDATLYFMRFFESCQSTVSLGERQKWAKKYYNDFKGRESTSDIDTKLTGENKSKMGKMIAEAKRIAKDDRYKYSQARRNEEYFYDCSSFVSRLYKKYFGISRLDSGSESTGTGNIKVNCKSKYTVVSMNDLQPGDILWREGHVALYIGNNQVAEAKNEALGIAVGTFNKAKFTEAYRVIK